MTTTAIVTAAVVTVVAATLTLVGCILCRRRSQRPTHKIMSLSEILSNKLERSPTDHTNKDKEARVKEVETNDDEVYNTLNEATMTEQIDSNSSPKFPESPKCAPKLSAKSKASEVLEASCDQTMSGNDRKDSDKESYLRPSPSRAYEVPDSSWSTDTTEDKEYTDLV